MPVGDEPQAGDQLRQAKATSNDAPLFNTLPTELFVKIFSNVYVLIRKTEIPWDKNWTISYQLVCRRWRDIICSTPELWREICICSSPRWLEFCLTRCAGALATVLVFRPTWPEETYATLRRYASSIKECHIHSLIALMLGLPSLLATPMPALETLSIDGVAYYGDDPADVEITITRDLFPRLTILDLNTVTAPRDTAVYISLRVLRLVLTPWTISYGGFLDVMGKCHTLQYLCLDSVALDPFIEQIEDPATYHPPCTTPVVLPRLRCMKLCARPKTLFSLLSTIHAPQVTKIELTASTKYDESDDLLVARLLAPNPQQRYPFLSSPCTVSLTCWAGAPFEVSVQCGSRSNASLSIHHGTFDDKYRGENGELQSTLVAIMDTLSIASVDTFEVEGWLELVPVKTWQRVFQTFSNLRTLVLKGKGTLDAVWLGLSCATSSSLEHGGTLCCPHLSEVSVDGRPDSPTKFLATVTLFGAVRTVLGARIAAGGIRLKKLKLHLEYTRGLWARTYHLGSEALEGVRALVEELDYQDWRES